MIFINTSNPGKLEEFKTFFSEEVIAYQQDLREPNADILTINRYKVSQFENVLVDDTSLEVEGAEIGVGVRWKIDELSQYEERTAKFICYLGIHRNEKVEIFRGEVSGTIVPARGKSFGFNPVFQPYGSTKTLAEERPNHFNARYLAVQNFLSKKPYLISEPLKNWTGPYQSIG